MLNVVPFLLSRAMQINIIFPMLHNEMIQLVDAFHLQVTINFILNRTHKKDIYF